MSTPSFEKKESKSKNQLFVYKFQPEVFRDFELEPELLEILKTLIAMDNLNILFMGDAGSGKTALLNAVIREYYGFLTPSQREENILYINNLKEQGINYYRNDVKTFCQTCSCIKNKKKIIVLDDIDFINEQSQQVFRNYIDKYSHNVHFIASCSNVQKVIESLQSRFIIMKLNCLRKENLHKIMRKIKDSEQIRITEEAEEFVLTICNHSAKTLINYMEKFRLLEEEITLELANQVCTNISFTAFEEYTQCLKANHLQRAIQLLYQMYDKGYSVMDILDNYFLFVKTTDLFTEKEKYEVIPFLCKYITVFYNVHEDEIELGLFTNNLIQKLHSQSI
jgi:DNA polymerase III delta prime subunit